MAASTDQLIKLGTHTRRSRRKVLAAKTLYEGTLCFLVAASGYATDVTATGANRFGGVVVNKLDNASGASGDIVGETITEGKVTLVNCSHSLALADVGKDLYASDNHTVTVTSTNNVLIGRLADLDDNSDPVIELKGF